MEHFLIHYVANGVWRIPVVAIGAAILVRVGGLGPHGRHRVWLAALAMAVVLPALPGMGAFQFTAPTSAVSRLAPPVSPVAEPASATSFVPSLPPIELDAAGARMVAAAFTAMVVLALIRLISAWRRATRLAGDAALLALAPTVVTALNAMAKARGRPSPTVMMSTDIRGPVVVGVVRPVILVPRAFARLREDDQRAALLHEMAHIVRNDFAVNLLCETAILPVSWHPVTYEIKAGVRRSRELACDAMASARMESRDVYARRLLSLAKAFGPQAETGALTVGLIGDSSLEERLMHLIKGRVPCAGDRLRLVTASALAGAILAPALLLHVAPAYAQAPAPALLPAATAVPAAPVISAPPAVAPAPTVAPVRIVKRRLRLTRADSEQAPYAPAPYAPAPPAPTPLASRQPIPPVPPAPPWVDEQRIRVMVERALAQSEAAREAFESARIEAGKAAIDAHGAELTAEERARLMAEARQGVEAWKRQHLAEVTAEVREQVRKALASEDVQKALASEEVRKALHEAARAADEARAARRDTPPD